MFDYGVKEGKHFIQSREEKENKETRWMGKKSKNN